MTPDLLQNLRLTVHHIIVLEYLLDCDCLTCCLNLSLYHRLRNIRRKGHRTYLEYFAKGSIAEHLLESKLIDPTTTLRVLAAGPRALSHHLPLLIVLILFVALLAQFRLFHPTSKQIYYYKSKMQIMARYVKISVNLRGCAGRKNITMT